jgi:hypothetical protein
MYVLYARYRADAAANATTATTGGTTIPSGTDESSGSSTNSPTTLGAWEADALGMMTGPYYTSAQAFNDITQWLSGQPVSAQGFAAIGNAIDTLGLPPGIGSLPPLTIANNVPTGVSSVLSGSGFLPPGATATTPDTGTLTAVDSAGNVYTWITPAQLAGLATGTPQYTQIAPGAFAPLTGTEAPNTPVYILSHPAAQAA